MQPRPLKNWKTGAINGRKILTLVTLEEQRLKDDQDEFGHDEETIYRVLRPDRWRLYSAAL